MGQANDLTGKRFGLLTAIAPTEERKNGYTVWRCRCDCGGEAFVPSRYLKNGWTRDCGCVPKEKRRQDLTGQRFGRLTVLEDTGRYNKGSQCIWRCRCDCGNEVETTSSQLLAGYKKSCGCLARSRRRAPLDAEPRAGSPRPEPEDWTGKRFGNLTVLSYAGKKGKQPFWLCRCDCGKELEVRQSNLQSGHTRSCGCLVRQQVSFHFVEGTRVESIRSRNLASNNTSGYRGVYKDKKRDLWACQITFQGKTKYLGGYRRKSDAVKVRQQAEKVFDEFLERYDSGYYD